MEYNNNINNNLKEKGVELEEYHPNEEITGEYDKSLAVKCSNGTFVGIKDEDVISYKGIPYAEPPVGNLRFKPPLKKDDSDKVYQAFYLGKTCIQTECDTEMSSKYKQGEDCLTLNIWKNTSSTIEDKPVMVFIHGGAFAWGGTADPLYEGTNFIKENKDVILVTINYRVNILGFINLSILKGGENYKESGNLGMLDQVCALKWVKDNIKNFGGNPNNVTIFGESAGGCAVSVLPLIKETKGLFNRIIAQSGTYQFTNSIETSLIITNKIIEITQDDTIETLLNLSEDEIRELISQFCDDVFIFPIRDGVILPKDLFSEFDKVDFTGLDFICGTNKDEFRYWIEDFGGLEYYKPALIELFTAYYSQFNERERKLVNRFLKSLKSNEIWNLTEFINEYLFRIPAIGEAEKFIKNGAKVYMYFWKYPSAIENFGACHAVELSSVFNNLKNGIYTGGKYNEKLAKSVQKMWTNFAKNGNPSIDGYTWNCYTLEERKTTVLDENIYEEKDILSERRKLLSSLANDYVN